MTVTLQVILLVASVLTFIWVLRKIRKAQVVLQDTVFWVLSSLLLILMGLFPDVVAWASEIVGVATPVNFLFLSIIFVLLVKVFLLSIKVSQLEYKLQQLVQHEAICDKRQEDERKHGSGA